MNGLLLVNLGSAKTPTTKDVKAYLREFLGDPMLLQCRVGYGSRF